MPTKAKYTDEDYQAIHNDLLGAKDGNEANEIFVAHAEKHNTNSSAIKNGYVAKAKWKRKNGDSSYLAHYETLFPGKVDTLATNLGTFTKNQILEWIDEFITYPIPNMEFVKSTLQGGQNDKFFNGILATFLMKDIEKYDELWHDHRDYIHGTLSAKTTSVVITSTLTPMAIFMLYFINMSSVYEGWGIVFVNMMISLVGLMPLWTYKETLDSFRTASESEKKLIERTNTQIMKKYPKELLDTIWNTHQLESIKQTEKDEEHLELAEKVYSGEVDFTENGLMDYAIYELNDIGWFASKLGDNFFRLWKPPHAESRIYRHFYNKAQCNFVDVEAFYRIEKRDGWE